MNGLPVRMYTSFAGENQGSKRPPGRTKESVRPASAESQIEPWFAVRRPRRLQRPARIGSRSEESIMRQKVAPRSRTPRSASSTETSGLIAKGQKPAPGGCGCRVVPTGQRSAWTLLLAVVALALRRRANRGGPPAAQSDVSGDAAARTAGWARSCRRAARTKRTSRTACCKAAHAGRRSGRARD